MSATSDPLPENDIRTSETEECGSLIVNWYLISIGSHDYTGHDLLYSHIVLSSHSQIRQIFREPTETRKQQHFRKYTQSINWTDRLDRQPEIDPFNAFFSTLLKFYRHFKRIGHSMIDMGWSLVRPKNLSVGWDHSVAGDCLVSVTSEERGMMTAGLSDEPQWPPETWDGHMTTRPLVTWSLAPWSHT